MQRITLTPDEINQLTVAVQSRKTSAQIAEEFGWPLSRVPQMIARHGLVGARLPGPAKGTGRGYRATVKAYPSTAEEECIPGKYPSLETRMAWVSQIKHPGRTVFFEFQLLKIRVWYLDGVELRREPLDETPAPGPGGSQPAP